jgi:hypothetical protein
VPAGGAVPETAVDHGLGRVEGGHRLAPLTGRARSGRGSSPSARRAGGTAGGRRPR